MSATNDKKRKLDDPATAVADAKADQKNASLVLFSYWRSSASWRARLALHYKGIPYTYRAVNLLSGGQKDGEYSKVNPMKQVPALVLADGRMCAQSMAIIDYLDHLQPAPPLFPTDPFLRAKAIELAEIVNSGVQPLQNLPVLNMIKQKVNDKEADVWAKQVIHDGLIAYQQTMSGVCGKFSVGDNVCAADFFLIPQIQNARRFGVDLTPFASLLRIESAVQALPFFATAHPDRQPDKPAA